MLINLIRNSIQANANLVLIELKKEKEKYFIYVKDNGSGISSENKDRIFEESYTTKKQGMGLGLAITRKFIESINGSIRLITASPGETIFELTIPVTNKEKIFIYNDSANTTSKVRT